MHFRFKAEASHVWFLLEKMSLGILSLLLSIVAADLACKSSL